MSTTTTSVAHFQPPYSEMDGDSMTIPTSPVTDEVQLARSVLTELAETGNRLLSRDRHLDVLLALDNLELSARGDWPPPDAAVGVSDIDDALTRVQHALVAILSDLTAHDVDPVRIALAHDHVAKALARQS